MTRGLLIISLLVLAMGGCARIEDVLVINADGSGSLTRTIEVDKARLIEARQNLPLTPAKIKALAGPEGIEVRDVKMTEHEDGGLKAEFMITFKDIHAFVHSDAGKLLPFTISDRRMFAGLQFDLISGLVPRFKTVPAGHAAKMIPGMVNRNASSGYRLQVKLPTRPMAVKGAVVKDNTVTWQWAVAGLQAQDIIDGQGNFKYPSVSISAKGVNFDLPVDAALPLAPRRIIKADQLEAEGFQLTPKVFQMFHTVNFTDDGDFQGISRNLSLNLQLLVPDTMKDALINQIMIDEALTDAGENLARPQGVGSSRTIGGSRRRVFGRSFTVAGQGAPRPVSLILNLNLKNPAKPLKQFTKIKGTAIIETFGTSNEVVLGPVKDLLGKKLEAAGVTGIELTLESIKPQVKIQSTGPLNNTISRVEFRDAEGEPLRYTGSSSGSSGGRKYHSTYRLSLPADGQIVFHIPGDKQLVELRFELKDIPLEADTVPAPDPLKAPAGGDDIF